MPIPIKVMVSLLALLAATTLFYIDTQNGIAGNARWVALALGPLMVLAIWIFPEAKQKKPGQ